MIRDPKRNQIIENVVTQNITTTIITTYTYQHYDIIIILLLNFQ